MEEPVVVARGLTRRYGELRALDQVNLEVAAGEWVAMMGPSGSGKTTLLNLIAGLDRPDGGSLRVGGQEISQLKGAALAKYRREFIGLVFQQFHLIPYLSALENVMLAQYFHSIADAAEAQAALERVGLGERLHYLPSQLSGGEQQRVCIARALINEPRLLLADEPTGNLDEASEKAVLGLFRHLHQEGHTVIMVTHDPDVARLADRIIRLEHGRVARGAPVI